MANDSNPAVNLEIVKGLEFEDLKSFKQVVMDWAIAMHFSTHTVKSDKYSRKKQGITNQAAIRRSM